MYKSFLGAFWILVIVGIWQLMIAAALTQMNWKYLSGSVGRDVWPRLSLAGGFIIPAIVLSEAGIYWMIRRRNRYYALSWAHSGIIAAAFLLNLAWGLMASSRRHGVMDTASRIHWAILGRQQRYLFWALVAVAHLAFFAVLANCARKDDFAPASEQGENLLDDVEL
ncbi:MAG TPA: hypothetical protein VGR89_04700 [Puia sp.]|nr:hypothetical protein [Puia sp.]